MIVYALDNYDKVEAGLEYMWEDGHLSGGVEVLCERDSIRNYNGYLHNPLVSVEQKLIIPNKVCLITNVKDMLAVWYEGKGCIHHEEDLRYIWGRKYSMYQGLRGMLEDCKWYTWNEYMKALAFACL